VGFVTLITGASSGIGEAAARRLAREPDARLILVARRRDRLEALAAQLGGATVIAADLTDPGAPARVREIVEREHGGELHLLVNNAGASWRGRFADAGWANVERHLALDFEAPVRLTEALLPLLRATAATAATATPPDHGRRAAVSIVNVASTAARVARPGAGGYSAAKYALAGWTDSLHHEETPHGVHVGLVLPGFVATEGFPATELLARAATRWLVSTPDAVADAILDAGPGGRAERYVPRFYWIFAALRILAPRVVRRAVGGGAFTTTTGHK
jgi:short-subunit dehydrogenase